MQIWITDPRQTTASQGLDKAAGEEPPRATGHPAPPAVPLLVPSIPSDQDFKSAICMLAQLVVAQRQPVPPDVVRPSEGPESLRVREFLTLDPPQFIGKDRKEDPQHFKSRGKYACLPTWDSFTEAFIDHYLPREIRDGRVDQFLNLRQGIISVREYRLRFDSLAMTAPPCCATCSKMHFERCKQGSTGCYSCGQEGHGWRNCPTIGQSTRSVVGSSLSAQSTGRGPQTSTGKGRSKGRNI
ncbi:hypothetical protein R3W88_023021 [Solanum pinnatisectum]|uniref:CCHC-type domain-containing protein n=1 Tax=Solanum pinnatisectum TaxID=50273 RepID=A0AAV9LXA4_9SOLN|nr:hypothetical protein R3W88_023021 [Solanum pinnatisectum]